jgi:hypothetical protein
MAGVGGGPASSCSPAMSRASIRAGSAMAPPKAPACRSVAAPDTSRRTLKARQSPVTRTALSGLSIRMSDTTATRRRGQASDAVPRRRVGPPTLFLAIKYDPHVDRQSTRGREPRLDVCEAHTKPPICADAGSMPGPDADRQICQLGAPTAAASASALILSKWWSSQGRRARVARRSAAAGPGADQAAWSGSRCRTVLMEVMEV